MNDATGRAVQLQIGAMNASVYEVGVYDPTFVTEAGTEGRMLLRTFDVEALVKSVPWLKSQNAKGNHIYIRPHGAHSLTLIDDLNAATVKTMKNTGYNPALVVETSPGNFQAWLQHGQTLPKEASTTAARLCAEKFDGDHGSADWRHFGRLAGFTNRKPKYLQPNGYFPFVKLIESSGQPYPEVGELLREVNGVLAAAKEQEKARQAAFASRVAGPTQQGSLKTIEAFRGDARYGGDQTRVDLAYATYALSHGISPAAVYDAIAGRDLSHKGGANRQAQYIERTMTKAIEHIQTKQQPRGRGQAR